MKTIYSKGVDEFVRKAGYNSWRIEGREEKGEMM